MEPHYKIIKEIYGNTKAARTGVPYINHIDEGLICLDAINASGTAKRAFCLHPLLQVNQFALDLLKHPNKLHLDVDAIITASMYANSANAYLCRPHTDSYTFSDIQKATGITERSDVSDMLLADKVQNYKDFLKYHKNTHPRSKQLDTYFTNWITFLCQFYNFDKSPENVYAELSNLM